jgi:hypothetical protein
MITPHDRGLFAAERLLGYAKDNHAVSSSPFVRYTRVCFITSEGSAQRMRREQLALERKRYNDIAAYWTERAKAT